MSADELRLHDGTDYGEHETRAVSTAAPEPSPSGTWFESELTIHGEGELPRQDQQGLDDRDPPTYEQ